MTFGRWRIVPWQGFIDFGNVVEFIEVTNIINAKFKQADIEHQFPVAVVAISSSCLPAKVRLDLSRAALTQKRHRWLTDANSSFGRRQ
jgi:hypothetical protein